MIRKPAQIVLPEDAFRSNVDKNMKNMELKHKDISMHEAQKIVDAWINTPGHTVGYFPPFQMVGQLAEEVGEVSREVANLHGHKKKKEGEKTEGLDVELADVMFAVICLANSEGIDLAAAFEKRMEKKTVRDKDRFKK
jgi:NTP pyrophosphatase (non-canonical NTP hydrolase)